MSDIEEEMVLTVDYSPWETWATRTADGVFDLNRCETLQSGDVNGDRRTDLICPYDAGNGRASTFVQVVAAAGGSYSPWQEWAEEMPFDLTSCAPLQVGDVNGDRRADLICPYDFGNASTATFVQTSTGTEYAEWLLWSLRTGNGVFDLNRCKTLQTGDVNRDGYTDLICPYDHGNESVATYVQTSTGTAFSPWQVWAAPTADGTFDLNRCKTLQAGDFNGNGRTDLFCPYDLGNESTITYIQTSTGEAYADWKALSGRMVDGAIDLNRCNSLQAADVNRDGRTDLVCPYDWEGDNRPSTFVQLSFGTTITAWREWTTRAQNGPFNLTRCKGLYTGDVNGNQRADLICPYDYGNGSTATFTQLSTGGSFVPWQILSARTANGVLNLNHCKPLVVGMANAGRAVDLICPFDHGNGSTATYVQTSVAEHDSYLPKVSKPK